MENKSLADPGPTLALGSEKEIISFRLIRVLGADSQDPSASEHKPMRVTITVEQNISVNP